MIQVNGLRVHKAGREVLHVERLSLPAGERLLVRGANGSGKTTLLRVLGGLERVSPAQCQVEVALEERVYVHQTPLLLRTSVLKNVTYGLAARGVSRKERDALALDALAELGIDGLARRPARELSGGETRRVAVARALVLRPKLLLLDESLAELDDSGQALVLAALDAQKQATIVLASPAGQSASKTYRVLELEVPLVSSKR